MLTRSSQGTFGEVYCAHDNVTNTPVAVKMLRNSQLYVDQGDVEVQMLRMMNAAERLSVGK
jgi:serine/threonine protein kinase